MKKSSFGPLVSTSWLAEHLGDSNLRIVDATYTVPGMGREAQAEFAKTHVIPGAVAFDIDAISDKTNPLPHMLPTPAVFAQKVSDLGLGSDCQIVVYDNTSMIGSPRVWWMFRIFGHDNVAILDGGLDKWVKENRTLTDKYATPSPRNFKSQFRPELVRDKKSITNNLKNKAEQILDARAKGRFDGSLPELRPGLPSGHIPGSLNLPFGEIMDVQTGTFLPPNQIKSRLEKSGVALDRPIVTTCGSGVTACVLTVGLYLLGRTEVPIYDGSWTEWASDPTTPKMP